MILVLPEVGGEAMESAPTVSHVVAATVRTFTMAEMGRLLARFLTMDTSYCILASLETIGIRPKMTLTTPASGEPLDRPGTSPEPGPITDVNRETWRLFERPDELYGHDAHGNPLTKEQYDERYREMQDGGEVWDKYPPNTGAAADTRMRFTSVRVVIEHFGAKLDRIGWPGGEYLGVMEHGLPGPFEARGLPMSSLEKPYYEYTLTGELPEKWSVEVSEIAPAFGRDGGGIQLVVIDDLGEPVSVEMLKLKKVIE